MIPDQSLRFLIVQTRHSDYTELTSRYVSKKAAPEQMGASAKRSASACREQQLAQPVEGSWPGPPLAPLPSCHRPCVNADPGGQFPKQIEHGCPEAPYSRAADLPGLILWTLLRSA
jgi:hypothetical protein